MTTTPVREFERHRSRLFGIAYRMLGSAAEAEDTVQDTFIRWHEADHATIASPAAWLAKVTTNLCLNRLTSAQARREQYVGPWLPEPVRTDDGGLTPDDTAEQRDSVSMALLLLLERLTPAERAVFVLREAFAYSHAEVADVLAIEVPNSRQLHRRALDRLGHTPARFRPDARTQARLVDRFLAAARDGELSDLERMLAEDAVAYSDGGGKVTAARYPVTGRQRVARLVAGYLRKFSPVAQPEIAEVNGAHALLGWRGDTLLGVMVFETDGDVVTAIRSVANPDKLGFLARQAHGVTFPGAVLS